MGHDNMSNWLLKKLNPVLNHPLAYLINRSLEEGYMPLSWKKAKIIPIFKNKGSKLDLANYRPISILPTFSKVIEKNSQ